MTAVLRPILELSVVLPGLLLAYFPVKFYLKQSPGKLAAWLLPLMAGLCIGGGLLCCQLRISTAPALALITLFAIVLYIKTLRISLEIRNDRAVRLRGICLYKQLIQSRQRSDRHAYAAAAG